MTVELFDTPLVSTIDSYEYYKHAELTVFDSLLIAQLIHTANTNIYSVCNEYPLLFTSSKKTTILTDKKTGIMWFVNPEIGIHDDGELIIAGICRNITGAKLGTDTINTIINKIKKLTATQLTEETRQKLKANRRVSKF